MTMQKKTWVSPTIKQLDVASTLNGSTNRFNEAAFVAQNPGTTAADFNFAT